jgi:hypothetical protein
VAKPSGIARRLVLLLLTGALVVTTSPAIATEAPSGLSAVSPELSARVANVRSEIAAVRAALAHDDLSSGLRGALGTAGFPLHSFGSVLVLPGWALARSPRCRPTCGSRSGAWWQQWARAR